MRFFFQDGSRRRRAIFGAAGVLCCGALVGLAAAPEEQPAGAVGAIRGDSISVQGPMKVEVVGGQVQTVLLSGSDVRVKSGTAQIELAEGGQITICGPAHFSVLKSGGSLTVALDSGTIHAHVEREPALTVYTPQIQARPVAIGGGAQDVFVGFDAAGAMCIRAASGAVRVEQQLTGQTIIVPQSGDVQLTNGQIESLRPGGGHCVCELQIAQTPPPEVSVAASAGEVRPKNSPGAPPEPEKSAAAPAKEEPVYQVFMPPLSYDASPKVEAEFDPHLIILVRRVRVRPTLIFQGRVEGEAVAVADATPPSPATVAQPPTTPSPQKTVPAASDSLLDRVRNFFRRLWTRGS